MVHTAAADDIVQGLPDGLDPAGPSFPPLPLFPALPPRACSPARSRI
ncbi:hypothetical protein STXM2123_4340 [Streptomyces sp. F-3]|nr:hypothetical protein STXM2123_4340 [Streptomyces sp. F-3]